MLYVAEGAMAREGMRAVNSGREGGKMRKLQSKKIACRMTAIVREKTVQGYGSGDC
jgi:hypothetical protein